MLLITMYCCSVHVFFLHSALLRWKGVIQENAMITGVQVCGKTFKPGDADIRKCSVGSVSRSNNRTVLPI